MHAHGKPHRHPDSSRLFAWATAINLGYAALEAGIGIASNSLALVSDALHNLGDAAGLALAWAAAWMAGQAPTDRHTFGWRRATQLSPLLNALILVGLTGALLWEALRRLQQPPEVPGPTVMLVAGIGILVNVSSAALFHRGQRNDLNKRGAYLHLLADAAVSLAAVVAGFGIWLKGWNWLDPAIAVLVALVVGHASWRLLKASFMQAMDAVPENLSKSEIEAFLRNLPGVAAVHHLHVWSLGAEEIALTAHIVRETSADHDHFIDDANAALYQRFGINHATLQIELGQSCRHDHHDRAPHH